METWGQGRTQIQVSQVTDIADPSQSNPGDKGRSKSVKPWGQGQIQVSQTLGTRADPSQSNHGGNGRSKSIPRTRADWARADPRPNFSRLYFALKSLSNLRNFAALFALKFAQRQLNLPLPGVEFIQSRAGCTQSTSIEWAASPFNLPLQTGRVNCGSSL